MSKIQSNDVIRSKVILVGTINVGKSTIVARLRDPDGEIAPQSNTIGCSFVRVTLQNHTTCESNPDRIQRLGEDVPSKWSACTLNEDTVILDVWDTTGQERYKAMCPLYFRKSDLIMCVFDVSNLTSIDHLEDYIKMVSDTSRTQFLFVGNKVDLDLNYDTEEIYRIIYAKLLQPYNLQSNSTVVYTSALHGLGLNDLRSSLVDAIYKVQYLKILTAEVGKSIDALFLEDKKSSPRCCGKKQ